MLGEKEAEGKITHLLIRTEGCGKAKGRSLPTGLTGHSLVPASYMVRIAILGVC